MPFGGRVPEGKALRILTGALLPKGVDTVVLEEDCSTDGHAVAFEPQYLAVLRGGRDLEPQVLPVDTWNIGFSPQHRRGDRLYVQR